MYANLIGLCAGALLVSSVLVLWQRSQRASIRMLAVQGISLAALVAVVGVQRKDPGLIAVFGLVLLLKAIVLPWLLARRLRQVHPPVSGGSPESPLLNPVAGLVAAALLSVVAYAAVWPLVAGAGNVAARATPVGMTMVLIGMLILVSRRRAISQLVGFLILDNGIATVAFLISGGLPLVLEFGAGLDILLVLLILQVFARQLHSMFGDTDVDRLRELHD